MVDGVASDSGWFRDDSVFDCAVAEIQAHPEPVHLVLLKPNNRVGVPPRICCRCDNAFHCSHWGPTTSEQQASDHPFSPKALLKGNTVWQDSGGIRRWLIPLHTSMPPIFMFENKFGSLVTMGP